MTPIGWLSQRQVLQAAVQKSILWARSSVDIFLKLRMEVNEARFQVQFQLTDKGKNSLNIIFEIFLLE